MSEVCRFGFRPRRRFTVARSLLAGLLMALAFGAYGSVADAGQGATGHVNIVRQGPAPIQVPPNTHYYTTIQAAVNASKAGDWVLIEPGVYYEQVKVTSAQSGIWNRGMNRNKVILDGQHQVANGIEIDKANNVWVQNLTVRNFDSVRRAPMKKCGNEIWWGGGGDSGKIGAHGWFGELSDGL